MFALLDASLGEDNNQKCSHIHDYSIALELHIQNGCTKDEKVLERLVGQAILETNNKCLCGLTTLHVVG